jgi:hypothetical protein
VREGAGGGGHQEVREGGYRRWRPPGGTRGRVQEVAATRRRAREGAGVGHQAVRKGGNRSRALGSARGREQGTRGT